METDPQELTTADEASLPPLRIHHFFLWTIAVATVFSGYKLVQPREMNVLFSAAAADTMSVLYWIPMSVAIATLLLGAYWRYRQLPFFCEPGHWLLVTVSLSAMQNAYLLILLWMSQSSTLGWNSQLFFLLPEWLNYLAIAGVYFVVWRRMHLARHWNYFFLTVFSLLVFELASGWIEQFFSEYLFSAGQNASWMISIGLHWTITFGRTVIACYTIGTDKRLRITRHWSHWCGMLIWTLLEVVSLISASYFFWWVWNGGLESFGTRVRLMSSASLRETFLASFC